jgi:hypothetical protein
MHGVCECVYERERERERERELDFSRWCSVLRDVEAARNCVRYADEHDLLRDTHRKCWQT